MKKVSLKEKIHEIRNLINESIICKQNVWDKRGDGQWSKLWCAFDNIEDTQTVIDEYASLKIYSKLATYGLLQAMNVQQDALKHIEESINIKLPDIKNDYPELLNIRQVRVETVGHPTRAIIGKSISYTSISPESNLNNLNYMIWRENGHLKKSVNIVKIIDAQHKLLTKEIDRVIKQIKSVEHLHRENFDKKSLSIALNSISYHIGKLYSFERSRELSKCNFETIKSLYKDFRTGIQERYKIKTVDDHGIQISGVVEVFKRINERLPKIERLLPLSQDIDKLDLDVYVESLGHAFEELQIMAKEIDKKFSI